MARKDIGLYIPEDQRATIYFTKRGEPHPETGEATEVTAMWMDVKSDLTFAERERLYFVNDDGTPMETVPDELVCERLAPFVLDWSVGYRDDKGKAVKAPPPAEAGGEQFALISMVYVLQLLREMRNRSTGTVTIDFLAQ